MIAEHVLNLSDPSHGKAYQLEGVGMAMFILLVIGACVYLVLRLPRRRGEDASAGEGGLSRDAEDDGPEGP